MPCSSCGSGGSYFTRSGESFQREVREKDPNCTITKEMLISWKAILTCLKEDDKFEQIGLNLFNINQLLGIVQSAINYPDDYCFYKPQLYNFQNVLLPKIVTDVPECIQQ